MPAISFNISARAHGVVRANNSCGRLWFSTSRASRAGSGSFFNLGGLGASREAQYLSKERGIPRTEYNSNIHLIRSSEVDPFAPAPGSTRAAAAKAAARAQAEHSRMAADVAARRAKIATLFAGAPPSVASPESMLQALKDELAETKRALLLARLKAERRDKGSETSMTSHLLSTAIILTAIYYIAKDVSERVSGSPKPVDGLIPATTLENEVDEATAQRRRDAPLEEQVLAESGLTTFEHEPEMVETSRRSVLSGLFWART